jgi:hypothetical protein
MQRRLTVKQKRFVQEYLLDLNATAAALRAGYRHGDVGRQLLTKNHVLHAVSAAQQSRAERCQLSADLVLRRLDRESRRGGPGASHAARVQALKLLGQHLGMFVQRHAVEQSGPGGGDIAVSVTHDLATDLAPYADVLRQLCTDPGGGAVPPSRLLPDT